MPKLETLSNGPARLGGRRGRASRVSSSLAEINVVPLVDVMLVLLVIFMVAAPMMQQGFPVRLPQSRRSPAVNAPVTVTVPIQFRKDHKVQIGQEFVSLAVLSERVRQALESREQKTVVLAQDGDITVAEQILVMDQLRGGGVTNVSIQTQPPVSR
jgi:biopolymer transport protein TolR